MNAILSHLGDPHPWTIASATKAATFLASGIGSEARGWLDGLNGCEPRPETEANPSNYERGWYAGAEQRSRQ